MPDAPTWPDLSLPILPPYPPMEAKLASELPSGDGWQFEPKWDGFRCVAYRDGATVVLQSKEGRPLGRYFPEVVAALAELPAARFVLDSEIVIPQGEGLSFDLLLQRIHPARSRVERLSKETPARLLAFDLLVDDEGRSLVAEPLTARRLRLEDFARRVFPAGAGPEPSGTIRLSSATTDRAAAERWMAELRRTGLDGVIAKRLELPYRSGERDGMQKVKALRTCDCVVGGFRPSTTGEGIGSLLLGLYDGEGLLHHIGHCSGLSRQEKKDLEPKLRALVKPPGFTGSAPGGPSRWTQGEEKEWTPLDPVLVVEVEYHHYSEGRFRHGTKLLRWRPDKEPRSCTMDQVE